MANVILQPNETAGVFGAIGSTTVFGTIGGSETITVDGDGVVTFVNGGGNDTIAIQGNAGEYTASVVGSNMVFTNAGGASIAIPFNPAYSTTIVFDDATRDITFKDGAACLGDQVIGAPGDSAVVAPGSNGTGSSGSDEQFLTANVDNVSGGNGATLFIADINQVNGLQVNTLGTGDRIDGNGGVDTLETQITRGSTYGDGNAPIQPRVNDVEIFKIEAMQSDLPNSLNNPNTIATGANTQVYFDASDVRGHTTIWSWESDADLIIQNLTTIVTDGGHDDSRNTGDITIGMGYTGSNDHNWDASDLHAYFDPDFLLSGKAAQSVAYYWLLDEAAELVGRPERLFRINVDGLRFTIDGGPVITLRDPAAQNALTHQGFIDALQDELQDLIDAGVVPADTTLTLDPTITDFTFLDDGSQSGPIPAMVLQTNTAAVITPVGFSQVEEALGAYDVYGTFDNEAGVQDLPVSVQIALEKAGRGVDDCCDAGTLFVGSMDKDNGGIPVFNVTVYRDDSRPSVLDELDSTGGVLDVINIASDNDGFPTDTYASLMIGDTNSYMSLIDATAFKGDLTLGSLGCLEQILGGLDLRTPTNAIGSIVGVLFDVLDIVTAQIESGGQDEGCQPIYNLQTLTATGGGNVTFNAVIDSSNVFTYTTGAGNDVINLWVDGEALDMANDGLLINTGDGADKVYVSSNFSGSQDNEHPNQIILKNVDIITGAGADKVETPGEGSYRISTGTGNDAIYSDNSGSKASWVFNVDLGEVTNQGGVSNLALDDLPGVPLQYSFIGGGTVRVTFSGAGVGYDLALGGGGVMEDNGAVGDEGEAIARVNGIEATSTIVVDGPRVYYGSQADINTAIIKAINDSPVLSKVLTAYVADNNTLVVQSLIDGQFVTEDLDIQVIRPTATTGQLSAIVSEGIGLGFYNSATAPTVAQLNAAAHPSQGQTLDNHFYSGILNNTAGATTDGVEGANDYFSIDNLYRSGSVGYNESDNVINGGADNDLIVLSTDGSGSLANNYWTLDGQLFDGASNEVIVLNGENFGSDTVFNFVVAGVEVYSGEPGGPGIIPTSGFDFLDLTAYLTSRVTSSGSVASQRPVLTTLEDQSGGDVVADFGIVSLQPNEVVILDFISDVPNSEFFAGLTASVVQNAINNVVAFTEWGNFDGGEFTLDDSYATAGNPGSLINGAASTVIMVQNDRNLGEYKFFQVTWTDDGNAATAPVAVVTERGTVDFGASLEGIDEINFILSQEALLHDGFGLNQYGPDLGPVI